MAGKCLLQHWANRGTDVRRQERGQLAGYPVMVHAQHDPTLRVVHQMGKRRAEDDLPWEWWFCVHCFRGASAPDDEGRAPITKETGDDDVVYGLGEYPVHTGEFYTDEQRLLGGFSGVERGVLLGDCVIGCRSDAIHGRGTAHEVDYLAFDGAGEAEATDYGDVYAWGYEACAGHDDEEADVSGGGGDSGGGGGYGTGGDVYAEGACVLEE